MTESFWTTTIASTSISSQPSEQRDQDKKSNNLWCERKKKKECDNKSISISNNHSWIVEKKTTCQKRMQCKQQLAVGDSYNIYVSKAIEF